MIEGKFLMYEDGLFDIFEIRKKVFAEELGFPVESLMDDLDSDSEHVIVFNERHEVVAGGRLSLIGKEFWISQVAVLKEERGKYYGDFVVRMLIDKVFRNNGYEVWVKADENAFHFFNKLGFTYVENVIDECKSELIVMKLNKDHLFKKCSN